ncbi:hypothetical protein PHMEG_00015941 [Phytophthora megakarya]|uniref:Reverse transcriptase n=1 Tax=Phytophthora megakarya TaxID=4795 RepID=A0A225W068_9STRA|nr:hypothetical protein PHMEG_00015941 [Phytophthora megakarya]
MINYSRSLWASPIVVIINKKRMKLTPLMVYPMHLINDLLEDLESTLSYCSLDMASGFWVFLDVFEDGGPVDPGKASVLGRRSYIDDILIPAYNWNQLCDRVEGLLEACDKWNLSISVITSLWGNA